MDVENIDALEPAELDALLEHALDPQVPVEVLYAVLERIGPPEKREQGQGPEQAKPQVSTQVPMTAQPQVQSPLEAQLQAQLQAQTRPGGGTPAAPGPQISGAAKHGYARPGQAAFGIGQASAPEPSANAAALPTPDIEAITVMRPVSAHDTDATTVMRPVSAHDADATTLMRPVSDVEETTVMRPLADSATTAMPPSVPGQPQHEQPVTPTPTPTPSPAQNPAPTSALPSPPVRGAATDRAVRPERPARPKGPAEPGR